MRSENYVYFWTNPYIKLYTLCMADIVMPYSSLRRSAGGMAGDSLGPGPARSGEMAKSGVTAQKKKKKASEASRGVVSSLRSPFFFFAFSPHFFLGKSPAHEVESNASFSIWQIRPGTICS